MNKYLYGFRKYIKYIFSIDSMIAWCLQLIKLERVKQLKLIKNARIITMDPQQANL